MKFEQEIISFVQFFTCYVLCRKIQSTKSIPRNFIMDDTVSSTNSLFFMSKFPYGFEKNSSLSEFFKGNTNALSISEEDRQKYLQELQAQTTLTMIPAMIAIILMAVIGVIGNSLVLYVYSRKFILNGTRVFILVIAVFDLVTNVVVIPGEVHGMLHIWDFDHPWACRMRLYTNSLTTGVSAQMLVALAVVRYRKVCVPFGWQISARQAKIIGAILILASFLFSIPYGLINGKLTRPTPRAGVYGHECSVDDSYVNTVWPLINSAFFFVLFLASCSTIVSLYYLVGTKALRHSRAMGKGPFSCAADCQSSSDGTKITSSTFTANAAVSETNDRDVSGGSRDVSGGKLNSCMKILFTAPKNENFSFKQRFSKKCARDKANQKFAKDGRKADGNSSGCLTGQENKDKQAESTRIQGNPHYRTAEEVNGCMVGKRIGCEHNSREVIGLFAESHELTNRNGLKISEYQSEGIKEIEKDKELQNPVVESQIGRAKNGRLQIFTGNREDRQVVSKDEINNETVKPEENRVQNCSFLKGLVSKGLQNKEITPTESERFYEEDSRCGDTTYKEKLEVTDPDNIPLSLTFASSKTIVANRDSTSTESDSINRKKEPMSKFEGAIHLVDITCSSKEEDHGDAEAHTNQGKPNKEMRVKSNSFSLSRQVSADAKSLRLYRKFRECSSDNSVGKRKSKVLRKRFFPASLRDPARRDLACHEASVNDTGNRSLNRTTVMLITISAVFIIGFIPYLSLAFYFNADPEAYLNLGGTGLCLYNLFVRSYFLNSASNAVIYGICDVTFRKKCISAVRDSFTCFWS